MQNQVYEDKQDGPLLMCLQDVNYGHICCTKHQRLRSCPSSCYRTIGKIRKIASEDDCTGLGCVFLFLLFLFLWMVSLLGWLRLTAATHMLFSLPLLLVPQTAEQVACQELDGSWKQHKSVLPGFLSISLPDPDVGWNPESIHIEKQLRKYHEQ